MVGDGVEMEEGAGGKVALDFESTPISPTIARG